MTTLPTQISTLSVAEKFELLDAIWQDIEAQTPGLDAQQMTELDRRMAKYEQNPSAVIPWEQIKAEILKQ